MRTWCSCNRSVFLRESASFTSHIYIYIHTHTHILNFASNFAKCKSRCDGRSGADSSAKLNTLHGVYMCVCTSSGTESSPHRFFKHPHWEIYGKYREEITFACSPIAIFILFHRTWLIRQFAWPFIDSRGGSILCDNPRNSSKNNAKTPTWHAANESPVIDRYNPC